MKPKSNHIKAHTVVCRRIPAIGLIAILAFVPTVLADSDEAFKFFEYENLSLKESLDLKTSVATKSPLTARESPDIITIVTRDEIQNAGARDLLDVLRLVPGFEFGLDIQGIIGIGFRGMWGQEGKILVLVDGQQYNDLGYNGTQIDRIPVAQIERLEVIRGPGSVIYGGNAEVAVINILTRGWQAKGTQAASLYGRTTKGGDRSSFDIHYGGKMDRGLNLSAAAHFSQTQRSDRPYTDINGDTFSMKENSDLTAKSINVGVDKGGFRSRFIADKILTDQQDGFVTNQSHATQLNSTLYLAEAAYDLKLNNRCTLMPRFNVKSDRPYNERDEFFLYDKTFMRYQENLTMQYGFSRDFNFLGGFEFQQDRAKDAANFWSNGRHRIGYENQSYFAQGNLKAPFGILVGGGRFEHHSKYKNSFVPRLAWTKPWGKSYLKVLYSEAFRAPGFENIRLNPNIRPEHLTTYQLEAGYEFRNDLFASLALFDTIMNKPIIYHFDSMTNTEFYSNDGSLRTHGFELTSRWKREHNYADLSYSYYATVKNNIPLYSVPGNSSSVLGWPTHKVALNSSFYLMQRLSLNPSLVVLANRFAYDGLDASGNSRLRHYPVTTLLNLFVQKKSIFRTRFDVGFGIYNLLDSHYRYVQPYNGQHDPISGRSREYIARVNYEF